MKQTLLIVLFILSAICVFGQKKVRKDIREGNKSYQEQVYNAAETSYKAALDANVSSPEAQYNLGNAYYKQKKWDDALKLYQQFVENPNSVQNNIGHAWHNIGDIMLRKNDLKKSEDAFKKALRINPNDDESRYNLATVQKLLKDKESQNKDQNQDQNQDKKDQDKKDDKKDQNKDQKDKDKQDQDKQDQNKQDQQQQMSQENIQQMLKAIEQDEKETQERVSQMKAQEKKRKNAENRRQNKDW